MKIFLNIHIVLLGTFRKEIDSPFVPVPGMHVEDPVWENAKPVQSVTLNYEEEYAWVRFESIKIDKSRYDQVKEMYASHDWETDPKR